MAEGLSRVSKLLVDRDHIAPGVVLARRRNFAVTIACGDDVAGSYTLQLAVLTAAHIAVRCFPGAVRIAASSRLFCAPLRIWPGRARTIGGALELIVGKEAIVAVGDAPVGRTLVFGDAQAPVNGTRVTFDGWVAQVGPAADLGRLPEREFFSATGVLAASLALSELFLAFANANIQATRRIIGLSLWRPDMVPSNPAAIGVPVKYLPSAQWMLGLGHLGNSFLWALGTLPYADPNKVEFALFDFDRVEVSNTETCLLFTIDDIGRLKTRVCGDWLEGFGYKTRLVERRFDSTFRRQANGLNQPEPGLAFCGFDSNRSRRDLVTAEFARAVECGLGARALNFDTLSLHVLPHRRSAAELWPDQTSEQLKHIHSEHERIARENPGYAALADDECGRVVLAGKAVGVPFVGAAAASFATAETVRLLNGGPAFSDLKVNLGNPEEMAAISLGDYDAEALATVRFATSSTVW